MNHAVVVDTVVFGAAVTRRTAITQRYDQHVMGKALVISPQTVAEMRFGALKGNWGQPRREQLEARIRQAKVAPIDDDTATIYATLKAACERSGHALGQKIHDADRWIAATALRYGLPLVTDDRIFVDAPGLTVLIEQS